MKVIKIIIFFVLIIVLIVVGCFYYAFKIEPYRIELNQYTINEKTKNTIGLNIVQFSDLHIKEDYTSNDIDKVIDEINEKNPDIVVFTGDLYDNYAKYNEDQEIIKKLNSIKAKYAKIAIWGNRDYGGGAVRQYESIMENAGFTVLKNQGQIVEVENKKILISGLDDAMLGSPEMPYDRLEGIDYKVLLLHEPDIVDNYLNDNYNLVLSGHSHGGQINIPLLPSINEKASSLTDYSSKYNEGMYQIENGKLYVNTGIGTTHISARFLVIPEIASFQIYL